MTVGKREKAKNTRLLKQFDITLEKYKEVLAYQKGVCAICKEKFNKKGGVKILYVDHCHKTGLLRGIICYLCNKGIAIMQDKAASMRNAYDYLTTPPFTICNNGRDVFTTPGKVGKKRDKLRLKMGKDGKKK